MAVPGRADREVRLNDVDWMILETLADGRRYTQSYLANDLETFEDHTHDWIRKRVRNLHGSGLIKKVGGSAMYVITARGRAALELREEVDISDLEPVELGDMVRERAEERSD
jgi:DNA-binding Lrp family transcriptional regulator